MSPYSEASNEELHAGRLQLPSGSIVVFDERIEEGKLGERGGSALLLQHSDLLTATGRSVGVENVRVIQDVLMKQSLAYRFPYSSFDFKTNITPIVLTEGKREALFAKVRFLSFSIIPSHSTLHSPLTLSMKSRLTSVFLYAHTPPIPAFIVE